MYISAPPYMSPLFDIACVSMSNISNISLQCILRVQLLYRLYFSSVRDIETRSPVRYISGKNYLLGRIRVRNIIKVLPEVASEANLFSCCLWEGSYTSMLLTRHILFQCSWPRSHLRKPNRMQLHHRYIWCIITSS